MRGFYNEYLQTKRKNKVLMILSAVTLGISIVVMISNVLLSMKNKTYKNALIDLSDRFPEEDEFDDRDLRWKQAHSHQNRTTAEERRDGNRITVEA